MFQNPNSSSSRRVGSSIILTSVVLLLHITTVLSSHATDSSDAASKSDRRRFRWQICNLILGSFYVILCIIASVALWCRIFRHKSIMSGSRSRSSSNGVHASHPYIQRIKKRALYFHLSVIGLIWLSSLCGIAAAFSRCFAFSMTYGWRLCYTVEFIGMMFFYNAALRIVGFWSGLATKTINKSLYRRWSSRVCKFFSYSLWATVNGCAVGLILFFLSPIPNLKRRSYLFSISIYTGALSFILSISFISYGLILLRYFHGKKIRKLLRLSLITLLATTSFFILCLMNLLDVLIIRTRKQNPQLLEAGPFVYLLSYSLCNILVSIILCWFFGCSATPKSASPNRVKKWCRDKVETASKLYKDKSPTIETAKQKPKLTINTDVALRVVPVNSITSIPSGEGFTPLQQQYSQAASDVPDYCGMSISSANTILSGTSVDSPFPPSHEDPPSRKCSIETPETDDQV